jgi:hypothetical protein
MLSLYSRESTGSVQYLRGRSDMFVVLFLHQKIVDEPILESLRFGWLSEVCDLVCLWCATAFYCS